MIHWYNADSFYADEHHPSDKPVLLFVYSERLHCCKTLAALLDDINSHDKILDNYFPVKVSSFNPSENDKRLINNHIFVASPILQVLNKDGSRSHEFCYVPRQTRHSKGYSYTYNENVGIFNFDLIRSQLNIGLAKYHLFNKNNKEAIRLAEKIIENSGNDENAINQAKTIVNDKHGQHYSSFLDTTMSYSVLSDTVVRMLSNLRHVPDNSIMKDWPFSDGEGDWKWYTDCVRELSFQIYQELITVSQNIELAVAYKRKNRKTHQILSHWHKNYRKLQADFIGVPDALMDVIAVKHERSLRENIVHCILCEGSAHGLQILNSVNEINHPECVIDFEAHQAQVGEITADLGPTANLFSRYEKVHANMLNQLKYIKDSELEIASKWWEPEPVTLKFRLDRLGWHLQDHLCTHRKLLAEMNFKPHLVDTFCQVIFEGMAQIECCAIGYERLVQNEISEVITMINKRTNELLAFLKK